MRRWLTAVALGGAAAVAVTGCGNPGGVDGELIDDWAAVSEPTAFLPDAGTCHLRFQEVGYLNSYNPVDCTQKHQVETIHVGTFTGDAASRATPPATDSPSIHPAWQECDKKSAAALGADWRIGRLTLAVVLPSKQAWSGGSRWFRCDLSEIESLDNREFVTRTGSLRDALAEASPLTYGCFKPKVVKDKLEKMTAVACDKKHRSEFAGVWTAPDSSYAAFERNDSRAQKGCLSVIAKFVKVPDDGDMRARTGLIRYYPNEDEWAAGDRGVRCFLWVSDRDLTKSLKGAGTKGMPVR